MRFFIVLTHNSPAASNGGFFFQPFSKIDAGKLLAVLVAHDETGVVEFFEGPRRREAAIRFAVASAADLLSAPFSAKLMSDARRC